MESDTIYNKMTKELIQSKDELKNILNSEDKRAIKILKRKIITLDKKIKKYDGCVIIRSTPGGNYKKALNL